MTFAEKTRVLNAARAAFAAGRKARLAAAAAAQRRFSKALARAAQTAANEAQAAAQAAEDAALALDPREALENDDVWETHGIAMGAADAAREAADEALFYA